MSDIFISYKREEQATARKLADALEKEGWGVWWDPKLRAGERFNDVIEKALKESKCVVVMWSKRSVESLYVKDEATYALNRNKLVPVMIDEVELPFRFEGLHTPNLLGWDGSKAFPEFRKLVDDISMILKRQRLEEERNRARSRQEDIHETRRNRTKRFTHSNWLAYGVGTVIGIVIVFIVAKTKEKPTPPPPPPRVYQVPKVRPEPREQGSIPEISAGKVFRDRLKNEQDGPTMVVISAGSFQMGKLFGGDQTELPARTVTIEKPFAIGLFGVTFDEYDRFVKAANSQLPYDRGPGRVRLPVVNVSWRNAVEYAKWLSAQTGKHYRLPSEQEWEYAARGGSFKPNVQEWLQDCYHHNADGSCHLRLLRYGESNDRAGLEPEQGSEILSFRVVRDLN